MINVAKAAEQCASGPEAAGRCLGKRSPFKQKLGEWTCMCARHREWACGPLFGALHYIAVVCRTRAALSGWWPLSRRRRQRQTCIMQNLLVSTSPRPVCYVVSPPLALCAEWGINPRPVGRPAPDSLEKRLSRRDLLWLPPEMDARAST